MASEPSMRPDLPMPPAPAGAAKDRALERALGRFDEKYAKSRQGTDRIVRLKEQTANPTAPSPRRPFMTRMRYGIAASFAFLLAGSIAWMFLNDIGLRKPGAPSGSAVTQSEPVGGPPPAPVAAEPNATTPAAPAPLSDLQASIQRQIASADRRSPATARMRLKRSADPAERRAMPYAMEPMVSPALDNGSPPEPIGRDQFETTPQNTFKIVREQPVSTFSIDVDTASYSFVRGSLANNVLPQPDAVRTEELINYFPYAYEAPTSPDEPFKASVSVFPSPWSEGRKLMRIGIKGYTVEAASRPRANLVFLIDTSGSMEGPGRLPLVKQSLSMLVNELKPEDRVAIVAYAGDAGTVLEPTSVSEKSKILAAIEKLGAGGSTAGGEGIRQAYALAEQNFDAKGVNRVILATDGDFNVGIIDREELKGFIERQRAKGIFLSVLGFGMGNYNDALMQVLAQNGNGAAAYIDTISEARKVLVEEATSTLFPIAKDVKIEVEFNPATVAEYRLIGYETRLLAREDFNNDKVDAGEVGSGQSVTALYEFVPVGGPRTVSDLRYGAADPSAAAPGKSMEFAFVRIRYKLPNSDTSTLISVPVDRSAEVSRFEDAPEDARFAAAVAAFGELLRGGRYSGSMTYDEVLKIASAARGEDPFGYRSDFIQLVRAAKTASAMPALRR